MIRMTRQCKILVLGHLPSADNRARLRARDQPVLQVERQQFASDIASALPLVRAWASLAAATYCPSTLRHRESAETLCTALGLPALTVDSRLDNVDYGVYKGQPLLTTPRAIDHFHDPYPGGTSWSDVLARWTAFTKTILCNHSGELVLLAGQSGAAARMLEILCDHRDPLDVLADEGLDVPFLNQGLADRVTWTYSW